MILVFRAPPAPSRRRRACCAIDATSGAVSRTSGPVLAAGAAPCGVCMQRSTGVSFDALCCGQNSHKMLPFDDGGTDLERQQQKQPSEADPATDRHRSTPACRGSWSHGSWATVPCLRGAMCQLTKKRLLMWRPLFFRSASASAFYIFSVRWTPQPSASVRSSLGHYGGSTRRSAQQSRSGRAENLFYGDWYISFTSHSSRPPMDGS